jgi:hypothetical protein
MIQPPPELDKIVDLVLAYKPPAKKKKLAAKAKKVVKTKKVKSPPKDCEQ